MNQILAQTVHDWMKSDNQFLLGSDWFRLQRKWVRRGKVNRGYSFFSIVVNVHRLYALYFPSQRDEGVRTGEKENTYPPIFLPSLRPISTIFDDYFSIIINIFDFYTHVYHTFRHLFYDY